MTLTEVEVDETVSLLLVTLCYHCATFHYFRLTLCWFSLLWSITMVLMVTFGLSICCFCYFVMLLQVTLVYHYDTDGYFWSIAMLLLGTLVYHYATFG